MKAIVEQCHKIKTQFSKMLYQKPIEAALLLGNLLLFEKHANDHDRQLIKETLNNVKESLTRNEVVILWDAINSKLRSSVVLDEKTGKALIRAQRFMLCDSDFIKNLPFTKIVAIGQNINFYRIAMIALVRRHLYFEDVPDPFGDKFNYDLLLSAGVEQNYLYLSIFLKQCTSLPRESLISLGKSNDQIATLLLKDLYNTEPFFDISLAFCKQFPGMRRAIALQWKQLLDNYPLTDPSMENVSKSLRQVSIYPEFSDVQLSSRVVRDHQGAVVTLPGEWMNLYIKYFGISSAVLLLPRMMNHIAHIGSFSAAVWYGAPVYPSVVGVCVSAVPVVVPAVALGTLTWMANRALQAKPFQSESTHVPTPISGTKSQVLGSINKH